MRKGIYVEESFLSRFHRPGARLWFNRDGVVLELLIFKPTRLKKKETSAPGYSDFTLYEKSCGTEIYIKEEQLQLVDHQDVVAVLNWIAIYTEYWTTGIDKYQDILRSQAQSIRIPRQFETAMKNRKKKENFCRILDTDRSQVLLVIKPLPDGSCQVSGIVMADGALHNKNWARPDLYSAQQFVAMFTQRDADQLVGDLNGENYNYLD